MGYDNLKDKPYNTAIIHLAIPKVGCRFCVQTDEAKRKLVKLKITVKPSKQPENLLSLLPPSPHQHFIALAWFTWVVRDYEVITEVRNAFEAKDLPNLNSCNNLLQDINHRWEDFASGPSFRKPFSFFHFLSGFVKIIM